jgi:fructose-bisphosphate aldolase class II
MQGSAGARRYAGEAFLRHLILAAIESHPRVPVVMHQDHGASPAACVQAIRSGFSSVMIDGSLLEDAKTPSSYDYNVEVTRGVVEIAHAVGVSVEGELGVPGPIEPFGGAGEGGHAVGGGGDEGAAADRSGTGRGLRGPDPRRRARDRRRQLPRRLHVQPQARR